MNVTLVLPYLKDPMSGGACFPEACTSLTQSLINYTPSVIAKIQKTDILYVIVFDKDICDQNGKPAPPPYPINYTH